MATFWVMLPGNITEHLQWETQDVCWDTTEGSVIVAHYMIPSFAVL